MSFYDLSPKDQERHMIAFAQKALMCWDGQFDRLSLVKYRENAVFSAYGADGRRVALRVHRPGYHSDDELKSELLWMQGLAQDGLPVPDVVLAKDGHPFVHIVDDVVPESRQVDMLTWLDGEQVGSIEQDSRRSIGELTAIYREIGRLAAQLHLKSEAWVGRDGFVRHAWDINGLVGSDPFWGRFLELPALSAAQRTLLSTAATLAAQELTRLGTGPNHYGLIHADLVPENLLVSENGLTLIDFDDAGYGFYMFELATALFFQTDTPFYSALETALFDGYREIRNKGVDERLLPLFMFARSATYLSWVHTRNDTETARELTPHFIERACDCAAHFITISTKEDRIA